MNQILTASDPLHDVLAYLALFFGTFVQEGAAIAGGALLIVERGLPPLIVGTCLFAGMVVGDLGIYGMGNAARRLRWASRWRERAQGTEAWLRRNLIAMIVLSRVVPGVLFPTFFACGWSGMRLAHFAPLAIVSAAIYTTLLLTLFAVFGKAMAPIVGHWTWIGFALLFVAAISLASQPLVSRLRTRAAREPR